MQGVKINKLEIENVKRIKAVTVEPTPDGLTVIGGRNKQGKTSILDAIAWALGGDRFRPSQANREGSVIPPNLKVVLSNGFIVERKGKNSSLKVTDPEGRKSGQQLLNEFVEEFALNVPKFLGASEKEKANILLNIIGVGDKLAELELKEKELYEERRAIGRIADQKEKYAAEQPYFQDTPKELISPSELIKQQQEILAKNGENQRKRDRLREITNQKHQTFDELQRIDDQIKMLQKQKDRLTEEYDQAVKDEETARKTVLELQDESTTKLEESITNIEEINRKVRANLDKEKAEDDAKEYRKQYQSMTASLNEIQSKKADLLDNADLPLPELSVENRSLIYKGQKWDNMSGSEQLKVATAIVRRLNPKCGFVLLDKLEQMDLDTLQEFGEWLKEEELQAIATRVSTGEECSIIIEDGYSNNLGSLETPRKSWKAGEF